MNKIDKHIGKIIQGHAPGILKQFPDESINMVLTSPPCWGLRDYGLEPQVWDGDVNCEHEWKSERSLKKNNRHGLGGGTCSLRANNPKFGDSNFCSKCNAWKGSLGLEPSFELYIKHLVSIFDDVKRVLRKDGTCWINLGDSFGGNQGRGTGKGNEHEQKIKQKNAILPKSLIGIPFRFALAMIDRGWILRNTIIWKKPNCMPSSAKDRFTVDFEYLFFFVKSKKYWYEMQHEEQSPNTHSKGTKLDPPIEHAGIGHKDWHKYTPKRFLQNGRNRRTVWKMDHQQYIKWCNEIWEKFNIDSSVQTIPTKPFPEAHFATFPEDFCKIPILSGCPEGGIVLDPFAGSGTVLKVAYDYGRQGIGIELNPDYIKMAENYVNAAKNQQKIFK